MNVLAKFLWNLLWGKSSNSGYSVRGFWGVMYHYDKNGKRIGYTYKDFWGRWMRCDENGKLQSYTIRTFWGAYYTYDADGVLIRKSYRNFWGGFRTYDRNGRKIIESYRTMRDGLNHYNVEAPDPLETIRFDLSNEKKHNAIQEMKLVNNKKNERKKNVTEEANGSHDHEAEKSPISSFDGERKIDADKRKKKSKAEIAHKKSEVSEEPQIEKRNASDRFREEAVDYYNSVSDYTKTRNDQNPSAKILVFSYGEWKDFPACVYEKGDQLEIIPLIQGREKIFISKEAVKKATRRILSDLDMELMDREFRSFGLSQMAEEFENFFPEYEFTAEGISRVEYEVESGLILTEKSWDSLRKMIDEREA